MTERRYSEEEVKEIFDRATTAQVGERRQLPSGEGMTLAALQEIGKEVGVAPELVAQAARSLDRYGTDKTRRLLGLPIGVGRTVELGRKMSDAEWERFVVTLRETFDASGRVRQEGAFRQWSNGRLQILVEPTATGHQVRMQTVRSTSLGLMGGGLAMLVASGVLAVSMALGGDMGNVRATFGLAFLFAMSVGSLGWGALSLPLWARTRRRQMEDLADRLSLPEG